MRFLVAGAVALAAAVAGWAAPPALLPAYRLAGRPATPADPLDTPVSAYRAIRVPVASAFLSLSRSTGIAFVVDPGIRGEVSLDMRGVTAREVADALARAQGLYWERDGRLVLVRRNVVRFYEIDYPQMTRSAQGSSNVVLSAQAAPSGGLLPSGAPPGTAQALQAGLGATGQADQTNISIQQQNQGTFWADVQAELASLAQPGESVSVNKLAGLAVVTASPARQADFRAFIEIVNRRISRQVRISARVLEVTLDAQHRLGVDWALATTRIGGLSLGGFNTAGSFATVEGRTLIPATFSGTLSAGKVSAAISALAEQGEVRSVSNPSVISLSNQTAFVKVGTEQTFFSLSNATTINQAGLTTPFSTTQASYSQNAITIGTVLYVTPEVNGDGTVTVDVLPAISQLTGVDSSPDGQQTAPRMDIKSLSTIARLHPGESVMIGGLIHEETAALARKIPVLGFLPLVGRAFGTEGGTHSRSELVIFLSAEPVP
jgi:MSHA biogenesis protein MshL